MSCTVHVALQPRFQVEVVYWFLEPSRSDGRLEIAQPKVQFLAKNQLLHVFAIFPKHVLTSKQRVSVPLV